MEEGRVLDMNLRRYEKADYEKIMEWLTARKFPAIPEAFLPSFGFVAEDGSGVLSACWVFRDIEGRIAWLVFPCTKPGLPPRKAFASLEFLLSEVERELGAMGFPMMFAATDRRGLSSLFKKSGWHEDKTNTQFFKKNEVTHGT